MKDEIGLKYIACLALYRDMPKAKAAQLTIFYAGSVNVFNNVSPEKV
jgi:hypothetical protein